MKETTKEHELHDGVCSTSRYLALPTCTSDFRSQYPRLVPAAWVPCPRRQNECYCELPLWGQHLHFSAECGIDRDRRCLIQFAAPTARHSLSSHSPPSLHISAPHFLCFRESGQKTGERRRATKCAASFISPLPINVTVIQVHSDVNSNPVRCLAAEREFRLSCRKRSLAK